MGTQQTFEGAREPEGGGRWSGRYGPEGVRGESQLISQVSQRDQRSSKLSSANKKGADRAGGARSQQGLEKGFLVRRSSDVFTNGAHGAHAHSRPLIILMSRGSGY